MRNSELSHRTSDKGSQAFVPLRRPAHPLKPSREKSNDDREIQLRSLKVLALTLLHEIERIETTPAPETRALDLRDEVQRFEAQLIRSALITTGGRQRRAARILGMKVTTLNSKIKRYGIDPEDLSEGDESDRETRSIEPFVSTHSM